MLQQLLNAIDGKLIILTLNYNTYYIIAITLGFITVKCVRGNQKEKKPQ